MLLYPSVFTTQHYVCSPLACACTELKGVTCSINTSMEMSSTVGEDGTPSLDKLFISQACNYEHKRLMFAPMHTCDTMTRVAGAAVPTPAAAITSRVLLSER